MTPKQLTAVMALQEKRQARTNLESLTIARVAAHAEKKDYDKVLKELKND